MQKLASGLEVPTPGRLAVSTSDAQEAIRTEIGEMVFPFQEESFLLGMCTVREGLIGDFQIPTITRGAIAPSAVAEGATTNPQDPGIGGPKLSPTTLSVTVELTNLSMRQTDGVLETSVIELVMEEIGYAIDSMIVAGTGAANKVPGILSTAGRNNLPAIAANMTLTWAGIQRVIREAITDRIVAPNGRVPGAVFVIDGRIQEELKSTIKSSRVAGAANAPQANRDQFVMEENGMIDNYPTYVTGIMARSATDHRMLFGRFGEVWVGFWGDVQIYRNAITQPGTTRITFQIWWDVKIPRPESFVDQPRTTT